jgi:hypothetical protein
MAFCTFPATSYPYLAHNALQELCIAYGVIPTSKDLDRAVQTLLSPIVTAGAETVLDDLHLAGFTLIALTGIDSSTFDKYFRSSLYSRIDQVIPSATSASLYSRCPSLMSDLLDMCRTLHPGIQPTSVLVVTTGIFRTVPPAHALGIPSVLVRHKDSVESLVRFRSADPTAVVENLAAIPLLIKNKVVDVTALGPEWNVFESPSILIDPYYFCNSYLQIGRWGKHIA